MGNVVYVATSLDGYIAASDGGLDWLHAVPNPEGNDYGWAEFISGIDAIVMGRNTFETVLGFDNWPYGPKVFVLSTALTSVPEHLVDRVEIRSGDVNTIVSDLNQAGYNNLYVDGGNTIQRFLAADQIDTLIITTIPVLLGNGIPLFGDLSTTIPFQLRKSEQLGSQLVKNYYTRDRECNSPGT